MVIDENGTSVKIKVIGVGGGGSNSVNRMAQELTGAELIVINTDAQALSRATVPNRIRIGEQLTRGLGVGGDPTLGARAAEESRLQLARAVRDADIVIVTAGMGGGTGTGAAPLVAELAKQAGVLTIGIVTKPFSFEGSKRAANAVEGIERLQKKVDTLIVIPNDRLLTTCERSASIAAAFRKADDVIRQAVVALSELITVPGEINLDFADVKTIMTNSGPGLVAIGRGSGENAAIEAAQAAMTSPLLDTTMAGARRVLLNITGGPEMALAQIQAAVEVIRQGVHSEANLIMGMAFDPELDSEVRITLIATDLDVSQPRPPKESLPKGEKSQPQSTARRQVPWASFLSS
jgi:cell division protein FtsZ